MRGINRSDAAFWFIISYIEKNWPEIYNLLVMKMSKENGIPTGLEPETSGLLDRRSTDWAMANPSTVVVPETP